MTRKTTLAASLAALAFMLTAGTAFAATAVAKQDVNIRAGAGTDYEILGQLEAGEAVDVIGCDGGWCEFDEGYVAQSYLSFGGGDEDDGDDEDIGDDDDEGVASFDPDEGEFDDDPLDLEDSIPESIHDGFDD